MHDDNLMSKVRRCLKDLSIIRITLSKSEENKEKYINIRDLLCDVLYELAQETPDEEKVRQVCAELKDTVGEYNDSGDNLDIKKASRGFATKIGTIDPQNYKEFLDNLILEDKEEVVSYLYKDVDTSEPSPDDLVKQAWESYQGQRYDDAFKFASDAKERGAVLAYYLLGILYLNGEGVAKDMAMAYSIFLEGAQKGDSECKFHAYLCLFYGKGIATNVTEAYKWLYLAALDGHPLAMLETGKVICNSEISDQYNEAYNWFVKAASADVEEAKAWVGYCYEMGYGVQKDIQQAKEIYKREIYKGNRYAKEFYERLVATEKQEVPQPKAEGIPSRTKTNQNPSVSSEKGKIKTEKTKGCGCGWFIFLIVLAGIIAAAYHFWYKDYRIDQATPRTYVYATNLFLRSSKVADVDDNRLGTIPYGSELITYSNENGWAYVKADGQKGYVSSDYLLDTSDFLLLNSVWGNEEAKEVVSTAKYRLALLDYYKRAGLRGGTEWQLYTKALGAKEDNVFYSRLFNKNSPFVDFAFLLKNNQTGERRFVLYSVDNETERPIFCHAMEAPKDAFINDIICNKRSYNVRMTVYYSNGDKTTVNVENAPVVQSRTTERPVSTSNTQSVSQNQTGGMKTARELNELGLQAYTRRQYEAALNYYNEAAKKGSDEALANLGWMTYKGLGTPVDGAIAISYLKDAVEMGNANACYYLGQLYENGVYDSQLFKDRQEALRYYKLGSDRGQSQAAEAYSRLKGSQSSAIESSRVSSTPAVAIPSSGLVFNQDLMGKPATVSNPFRQRGGAYTIAFWTDNFSSRVILSAIHPDRVQGWEFPKVTFQPNGIFLLGTEDRSSVSYAIFPYDLTKLAGERHFICVICQPGVYQKEKLLYIDGRFIASLPNPQVAQSQSACPNIQIGSGLRSVFFYIKALTSQEVLNLYQASK